MNMRVVVEAAAPGGSAEANAPPAAPAVVTGRRASRG